MRYNAVLLDLYGTLVDIHTNERDPKVWEIMAKRYTRRKAPWNPQEMEEAFFATISDLEKRALENCGNAPDACPEIDIEKVFKLLYNQRHQYDPHLRPSSQNLRSRGARRFGFFFRKASTEYIRLYDGAASFLKDLRDVADKVILLTNAQSLFVRQEMQNLGIFNLFDALYISSEWMRKKPDPYFYHIPLQIHHLDPARTVMIGNDAICDVQGAQAAGLHTVYLRTNLSPEEPLPQADLCVEGPDYDAILAYLWESTR